MIISLCACGNSADNLSAQSATETTVEAQTETTAPTEPETESPTKAPTEPPTEPPTEQEEDSMVYDTYTTATTLTKYDLSYNSYLNIYGYNDIAFLSEDCDWIDSPLNKDGSVEPGAFYRKLANCLVGFSMGNDWDSYARHILGFTPNSRDEFAPYVDSLSTFITRDDTLTNVMQKFETISYVEGNFDYSNNSYHFTVSDLSACAGEMGISEEMLGYIFAMLSEYAPTINFQGDSCTFSLN